MCVVHMVCGTCVLTVSTKTVLFVRAVRAVCLSVTAPVAGNTLTTVVTRELPLGTHISCMRKHTPTQLGYTQKKKGNRGRGEWGKRVYGTSIYCTMMRRG